MIVESDTGNKPQNDLSSDIPDLILCAVNEPLAAAWSEVSNRMNSITAAEANAPVRIHQGSILEVAADAVVSPANSFGWMRGGIDATYRESFPEIEDRVRSSVLAFHGGELPVGEAVIVATGQHEPEWLISAPTMRETNEILPVDTVHPFLAARAAFLLWRDGLVDRTSASSSERVRIRDLVHTIALPGLGTGIGGVAASTCAHQVAAAWEEVFGAIKPSVL